MHAQKMNQVGVYRKRMIIYYMRSQRIWDQSTRGRDILAFLPSPLSHAYTVSIFAPVGKGTEIVILYTKWPFDSTE